MAPNGGDDEQPSGQQNDGSALPLPEEIICILKQESAYEVVSLHQGELDGKPDFKLYRNSYSLTSGEGEGEGEGSKAIAQDLLDDFLIPGAPVHLQPGPGRRVHVLVSTHSGTGLGTRFYSTVLAPLLESLGLRGNDIAGDARREGYGEEQEQEQQLGSYNLVVTQDANSVKKFARDIARNRRRENRKEDDVEHTVVLLSGDGGIVDMLNSIASTEEEEEEEEEEKIDDATKSTQIHNKTPEPNSRLPLLALLPLGTGNALFNSLHRKVKYPTAAAAASDLVQGLRTLLRGKAAPLPSFKAMFPTGSRTISYSEPSESAPIITDKDKEKPSELLEEEEEHADAVTHLYGVVVASYGFHSQLVWESDTPTYRRHGAARFQMVAQELLKESHAYNATIQIACSSSASASASAAVGDSISTVTKKTGEDENLPLPLPLLQTLPRKRHAYILATLVSNLEKTFCISPSSEPLDGRLRLVHFGPVDGAKTMEIMMAAYDGGKHVGMRWTTATAGGEDQTEQQNKGQKNENEDEDSGVGYEEIEELRITTHEEDARWRKVCIDGTIVEIPRDGCMVVRKEARHHLRVLVHPSVVS